MEQKIYKGAAANDKTGTPARQAADIINGNFQILEDRITGIQNPDGVLKKGDIETDGLNVDVAADAFEWQINQEKFLDNPAFHYVLDAATLGYYRKDVLLGNNVGGYNIFKGDEDPTSATEPNLFPAGTIKLGVIDVYGGAITGTIPLDISGKEDKLNKNQPNGYAGLDSSGRVFPGLLPSYVDDVLEGYLLSNVFYSDVAHTIVIPAESGKVYVDITTGQKNKQYRYSGSAYIQITNGLIASTDDVPEGETNKYSTLALVMAYVLTGVSFATGTPITAADNILSAFGKLQKQITDLIASVSGKQVLDTQIEIGANGNVQNSWHGQTILFTANCTITVPATLNNSLMFPFRTLTGVTVTWAITSPFVWETTPLATTEKTTGHFMRRGATNTILLDF